MVIFLIGFMGSGKNWWGRILADNLHIPFFDLDREIEVSTGIDIVSIFRDRGEVFFRQTESSVLASLLEMGSLEKSIHNSGKKTFSAVIATGGGTPCFHNNMDLMNRRGLTVWLNPSVEELATRLKKETGTRPLLQGKAGKELVEFIAGKLAERHPFYKLAQIEIKNTHIAVAEFINILNNASDLS
jgi:shikimate kinase